jgi:PAS domain S-box-containing protein
MQKNYHLGLRGKVVLGLALLFTLSLSVTSFLSYQQSKHIIEKQVIELEDSKLSLLNHGIQNVLTEYKNTLLSLRDVPSIQVIYRARANAGIDPVSGDSLAVSEERLSNTFTAFAKNHPQYLQIRYIDETGHELVRVTSDEQGNIIESTDEKLQNKSHRKYFSNTIDLPMDQVYFSNVSLNREYGKIQVPYQAVLRVATPVYADSGAVAGIIVINVLAAKVFSNVNVGDDGEQQYVVDEKGNYLKHNNSDITFAMDKGLDHNFHSDKPSLALLSQTFDQSMALNDTADIISGFQKIYYSPNDKSRYWLLVLEVAEDLVLADIIPALNNMLTVGAIIGILSLLIIIWFISKRIVNPVIYLAQAAEKLQEGDLSIRLDESKAHDEFKPLYAMLNLSTSRQQNFTGKLQRDIESQARKLAAVIDNVVDGIITIDEQGIICSFNKAAKKMFQYEEDEIIGKNINSLMSEPYHSAHDDHLKNDIITVDKTILSKGREAVGLRKDGTTFSMEQAVSEVMIDQVRHLVMVTRDITERKRVEQMQKEFVSTVSHELRTPLTSISGSLGLILGGVAGELPEQIKALLTIANNNSERLIHLINDILDIEKISAGKMHFDFKPTNVVSLIEQALEANKGYGEKLRVQFEFMSTEKTALLVNLDEKRMMQVMSNLLSNAAKYSPANDVVDIKLELNNNLARISVHDKGKGIPEEFKPKIFSKFSQADSSDTRQKGGTGLGLNITQAIVLQHNGQIGFESSPVDGTTFYVELPLLQTERSMSVPAAISDLDHPLILIIEDDKDISSLLGLMLEKEGFSYHQAYDYQAAMTLIAENHYHAVTLDLKIPGGSGLALLRELRSHDATRNLPVIIVSATVDDSNNEATCESLEVVDWIEKPIDSNRLHLAISAALHHHHEKVGRILHVEDDADIAVIVDSLLNDSYQVIHARTLAEAKMRLSTQEYDLVLLDIGLPDGSGLDLLGELNQLKRRPSVVIFSAQDVPSNIATEVDATLVKSKTDNQKLMQQIKWAINRDA